jgi:hypothetical protein
MYVLMHCLDLLPIAHDLAEAVFRPGMWEISKAKCRVASVVVMLVVCMVYYASLAQQGKTPC